MQDDQRSLVGVGVAPPAGFAAALFGRVAPEDLRAYDAKTLALLAESAWRHLCARRERDRPGIRLLDPAAGDGPLAEITVLEVVNDDMPFLLDSTLGELAESGLELRLVAHPVFSVQRDDEGRLIDTRLDHGAPPPGFRHESLIHIHLTRITGEAARSTLERALETTFGEVRLVGADRAAMMEQADACARALQNNPPPLAVDEIAEAIQFLDWLLADNFVFLGQRQYRFEQSEGEGSATFSSISDSGLGNLARS